MGDEIKDMKESIDKITENVRSLSRMIKAYDNGDIVWLGFDGDMKEFIDFFNKYIHGLEVRIYTRTEKSISSMDLDCTPLFLLSWKTKICFL